MALHQAPAATAYPEDDNATTCTNQIRYQFDSAVPSNKRDNITEGFERWNILIGPDSDEMFDINESSTGTIDVLWLDLNGLGKASCLGTDTWIKLDHGLAGNKLRGVAMHEMGHILKLDHTGDTDSFIGFNSKYETMATCTSNTNWKQTMLSLDDFASATKQFIGGTYDWMSANGGFEQPGDMGWTAVNTPVYFGRYGSSSSPSGSYYGTFTPDANNDGFMQRVNLTGFEQDHVRIATKMRRSGASSGFTGKVWFSLYSRYVDYSSVFDGDFGCDADDYPASGKNENERAFQGLWQLEFHWKVAPSTSWQTKNSWGSNRLEFEVPSHHDAYDVRLEIHSRVKNGSGNYASINFDDLRIEQRLDG